MGESVGEMLGVSVGESVGERLGALVGLTGTGTTVILLDAGATVGEAEAGATVGFVGAPVGFSVGENVGSPVGVSVGGRVGGAVKLTVPGRLSCATARISASFKSDFSMLIIVTRLGSGLSLLRPELQNGPQEVPPTILAEACGPSWSRKDD